MKRRKIDPNKVYEKIGITVEKIAKEIVKVILLLPIITYFINDKVNLFLYLVGILSGNFICFFISEFIFYIINRMKNK